MMFLKMTHHGHHLFNLVWETEAGWEEEQLGNEQQDYDYGP